MLCAGGASPNLQRRAPHSSNPPCPKAPSRVNRDVQMQKVCKASCIWIRRHEVEEPLVHAVFTHCQRPFEQEKSVVDGFRSLPKPARGLLIVSIAIPAEWRGRHTILSLVFIFVTKDVELKEAGSHNFQQEEGKEKSKSVSPASFLATLQVPCHHLVPGRISACPGQSAS